MKLFHSGRSVLAGVAIVLAALVGGGTGALGLCGAFTDTAGDVFCPFVLEIFYLGITTGTTATTYDPAGNVSRLQMAAFLSRTVDGVLKRASRRAALDQFWTPQNETILDLTTVGIGPQVVRSDGADLWVANFGGTVSRVRGSDGKLLETWTGATNARGVLVAMGRVFVTGWTSPGQLYQIVRGQPAGAVTTVASNLGTNARGIAFDGSRIWVSEEGGGSMLIVTPGVAIPWTVTTVTTGFSGPFGVLYDGANVWVTNQTPGTLLKLDAAGVVLQTVTVGTTPFYPIFDGTNIWVPNANSDSVSVVRASDGAVLATLTGNGLSIPTSVAFDGQRVLATNLSGNSVSLWKAADFTPLGVFPTGTSTGPLDACSDGVDFWITFSAANKLARFGP